MKPNSSAGYGIHPVYKILLALLIIFPAALLGGLMYLYSLQPQYSGRLALGGLHEKVEVIFNYDVGKLIETDKFKKDEKK